MTRNHRRWHAWLWLILGLLIVAGFVAGLWSRPTPVFDQSATRPNEPRPNEPRTK
jgi:hypothetical protein